MEGKMEEKKEEKKRVKTVIGNEELVERIVRQMDLRDIGREVKERVCSSH